MSTVEPKLTEPPGTTARGSAWWFIILVTVLWLLFGAVISATCEFIIFGDITPDPRLRIGSYLIEGFSLGSVLLLAAFFHGSRAGHGNISLGLSNLPIARPFLVAALVAITAIYSTFIGVRFPGPYHLANSLLVGDSRMQMLAFVVAFLLAPIAQELFFRGWMWNAFRANWNALPTALAVSTIWLCLALGLGPTGVLVFLPVAALTACARHFAGSVRAPIAVHMTYGLVGLAAPWIVAAYR